MYGIPAHGENFYYNYLQSFDNTVSKKIRATTNSNQHSVVTEIWLLYTKMFLQLLHILEI